jgi:phosphoesterase RecJ-like protein
MFEFNSILEDEVMGKGLKKILVLAHINPDGDAVGSTMALAHYLQTLYPDIMIIPYLEQVEDCIREVVDSDKVFKNVFTYPFYLLNHETEYAVICCDTATVDRVGGGKNLFDNAQVSIVIDHHLLNSGYADFNYLNTLEACAENVYQIIDWERLAQMSADKQELQYIADYIYLGTLHDTTRFTRIDQLTLKMAGHLIEMGADHKKIEKTMHGMSFEDLHRQNELLSQVTLYSNKVAYLYLDLDKCNAGGYTYHDIHKIAEIVRDCSDIEVAFSLHQMDKTRWKCSMRSSENFDSNEFLKKFQGGGHKRAAGFIVNTEKPDELLDSMLAELKNSINA